MKIVIEKPPIWDEANKLFKLDELNLGTIFTFGDTLYNPFNVPLTDDLIAHEECHARQHQYNDVVAKIWWKHYLADPAFRAEQEAEAYAAQYKCICKSVSDRNARVRRLHSLASQLSGPMYDHPLTHSEAVLKIKNSAKI